ncbi:SPT3 Dosage dependent suppressor of Ty-induced promoter mutations-like protein [Entomortierella lignicola]|nr:SPT3 Dosage dependent suppressor of Ty-induced promoter mutations-like protein [Entomortierella lignicola]
MYPSPAPSSNTPVLPNASLSPESSANGIPHTSTVTSLPTSLPESVVPMTAAALAARQSLTPQVSPHLNAARPSSDSLTPSWSPADPSSSSPSSTASMPAYLDSHEPVFSGANLPISNPLTANNLYARSLHTPFYQMDMSMVHGAQYGFGSQLSSDMPLLSTPLTLAAGNALSHSLALSHSRLPAFDVKAYTFRKKPRHYVAVKHKNALRIEPIIYLKTSILDENRQVVQNWDYLRFSLDKFRENAQPKKKLGPEEHLAASDFDIALHMVELRGARILDVDIVLISPNNKDRIIEDSCPACVMRMDGERKIMQVLAKNFKQGPSGEPLIDVRRGHAIVCIKLNCYCDHHNEQEGFVVRMQTSPEVVRMGGSVKLRICCEARSKTGNDQDAEEEDGLTDIDAPVSTGSRSPVMVHNEQMLQSPSLSHASSNSPVVKGHRRNLSTNSSSMASPRSMDERVVNSLRVESGLNPESDPRINTQAMTRQHSNESMSSRVIAPPKFRQIYPLTPSEGTILGGTRVTIHGAHFDVLQNPVVFFGKVPAELVTISHHDVMECTTPPAENLKPGIVQVRIASLAFPLNTQTDSVDFMYMAPPDYEFYNLAATSLSYAMASEYPQDNSLAYLLNGHGSGSDIGLGLLDDTTTIVGNDFDVGFSFTTSVKENMVLDFLQAIQSLAPGRILPSFRSESGHTLLHIAAQSGMSRLVKMLLDMGIDHTAMDRNNKTALHFARMVQNEEITRMLLQARVPPRPMVPRLDSSSSGDAKNTTRTEIVTSLIHKYEEDLIRVVKLERYRKRQSLQEMRNRVTRVLELKDQVNLNTAPSTLAQESSSTAETTKGPLPYQSHPRGTTEDTEEDDIMDDMSNPSSPEGGKSHDETGMDWDEDVHERDETESKPAKATLPQPHFTSPVHAVAKTTTISPTQRGYIQGGTSAWENSRSAELFGAKSKLLRKTGLQTWICDKWSVSSLKGSMTQTSEVGLATANSEVLHIMALTGTGLHHFLEQRLSSHEAPIRRLEHWSLIEIEQMNLTEKTDETAVVSLEMCGFVSRGGRDILGERVDVELPKESAQNFLNSIREAHNSLMHHLNLRQKFEIYATAPKQPVEKNDEWIESTFLMWGKVFGIDDRLINSIDYVIRWGTFTLQPMGDGEPYSILVMAAIMRTLREYDQCSKVRFEGVQVLDGGWRRPELIKELERMTREMKNIDRWNFAGCGWTSATVEGFLRGFSRPDQMHGRMDQDREPCRRISLARNDFGGEDTVGHLLARCLEEWRQFKTLDLTDCNIGLAGVESLVNTLKNMFTIRLQGNQVDNRWWHWVDTLLAKNHTLKKCRLGAPIPPSTTDGSLIDAGRLSSLQDLSSLDLSTSLINQATLTVLNSFTSTHVELSTLALCRSGLEWTHLATLFKTICTVNKKTKFTLDVSQNELFESEAAVQAWTQNITEGSRVVGGVPFGVKMQGLIVQDSVLRRILEPLEEATCLNEFNVRGLLIKRESQVAELKGMSYKEAVIRLRPEDASEETCLALGRVLAKNSTLKMLDVSGREVIRNLSTSSDQATSSRGITNRRSAVGGRSSGGFGRNISLAFPGLANNRTLMVLWADYNRFGEAGLEALAEALRTNTGLGKLSSDGNDALTLKSLKAIEKVLPPFSLSESDSESPLVSDQPATFQGTVEEAQAAGYNSTLVRWSLKSEEISIYIHFMDKEIARLMDEYNRIETLEKRRRDQEAKFGHGAGQFINGASLLVDAKKRYDNAVRNRGEYVDTVARVIGTVNANDRRTLSASRKMSQA